jgi:hypothetical protein
VCEAVGHATISHRSRAISRSAHQRHCHILTDRIAIFCLDKDVPEVSTKLRDRCQTKASLGPGMWSGDFVDLTGDDSWVYSRHGVTALVARAAAHREGLAVEESIEPEQQRDLVRAISSMATYAHQILDFGK